MWIIACVIPFGGIFVAIKTHKQIINCAKERGVEIKDMSLLLAISCIILPVMGINVVTMGILQSNLNRIYAKEDAISNGIAL